MTNRRIKKKVWKSNLRESKCNNHKYESFIEHAIRVDKEIKLERLIGVKKNEYFNELNFEFRYPGELNKIDTSKVTAYQIIDNEKVYYSKNKCKYFTKVESYYLLKLFDECKIYISFDKTKSKRFLYRSIKQFDIKL